MSCRDLDAPLVRLDRVTMQWDRRKVLDDVSFTVNRGDFVAITGPNGGGKTTLLRVILKLLVPTRGTVSYLSAAGGVVDTLPIGYLPQKNMIDSRFPILVREVVASGLLGVRGMDRAAKRKAVDDTLARVDMAEHASRPIGQLSGGQLQRALLGRALISNPQVLVLDEPLSYIDKRFETRFYKLIEESAADTTILLVSHEMTAIAEMANRHLIVDHNLHECTASHHYFKTECDDRPRLDIRSMWPGTR